jgi:anti-sigma factor RsiW
MKSEVLERLLIDRAAGQLSPDVAELLEARLQHEPAARRDAAEIAETLRLARLALAGRRVVALPASRPSRPRAVSIWAWAMAACFVCGLSLGIFAARGVNDSHSVASAPAYQTAATTADESGFWSVRRLRAALPRVGGKPENSIVWKSPVMKPEIL